MNFFRSLLLLLFLSAFLFPSLPVKASASAGDIVSCSETNAVYYLAEDGNRYAFPNENVYYSWYENFNGVKDISCADLASLFLAGLVPYQAGSALVKIQTVPTVYVIEPNGILRSLSSEAQAQKLYGEHWAQFVQDIPDVFFSHYTIGQELTDGELPIGIIIQDQDIFYRFAEEEYFQDINSILETGIGVVLKQASVSSSQVETYLGQDWENFLLEDDSQEETNEQLLEEFKTVQTEQEQENVSFEEVEEESVQEELNTNDDQEDGQQEDSQFSLEDLENDLQELDEQTQEIENLADESQVLDDEV